MQALAVAGVGGGLMVLGRDLSSRRGLRRPAATSSSQPAQHSSVLMTDSCNGNKVNLSPAIDAPQINLPTQSLLSI